MNQPENPWERAYKKQGSLWAGNSHQMPKIEPVSRILETGCGNGKTVSQLCSAGNTCHGIDISISALKIAGEFCGKRNTDFFAGDITYIPAKEGVYDAVVSFHTISHLNEAERITAAAEIYRVLKKGGRFYFRDFGTGDLRYGKGVETEKNTYRKGNGISTHFFELEELKTLFRNFNLTDVGHIRWNMKIKGRDHQREEIQAVFLKE